MRKAICTLLVLFVCNVAYAETWYFAAVSSEGALYVSVNEKSRQKQKKIVSQWWVMPSTVNGINNMKVVSSFDCSNKTYFNYRVWSYLDYKLMRDSDDDLTPQPVKPGSNTAVVYDMVCSNRFEGRAYDNIDISVVQASLRQHYGSKK